MRNRWYMDTAVITLITISQNYPCRSLIINHQNCTPVCLSGCDECDVAHGECTERVEHQCSGVVKLVDTQGDGDGVVRCN